MNTSIKPTETNNFSSQRQLAQALKEYREGNIPQVELILNNILEENPGCTEALKLLAMLAHANGDLDKARVYYQRIIEQNSTDAQAYYKLGIVYQQKQQFVEAINILKKALFLAPRSMQIAQRLAYNLGIERRLKESITLYNKILEARPDNLIARWNLALTFLKEGNFSQGLAEFECRKNLPEFAKSYLTDRQMWDGSNLDGKRILVWHADDGLGDIIQFIRYTDLLEQQGGQVIFAAPKPLLKLFSCISSIKELVPLEAELPAFDVYVPLLSLPYICQTTIDTIPNKIPYLTLPKSNLSLKDHALDLPGVPETKLKIGIAWSSGHRERNDTEIAYNRDCQLSNFIDLLSISNISLYSLQVGKWARDVDEFKQEDRLFDLTPQIQDFVDTANFISQLDLVISVDTAVAHLAGAMGKSVWTLLPYDPDWRWMIDREDSPWYPSMRLFRQAEYDSWEGVFQQVKIALTKYLDR